MTTTTKPDTDAGGEAPVACILMPGTYQERLSWIAQIARDGLRRHERRDLVLDLHYATAVADRVREMVRKEEQCCGFLTFAVAEDGDEIQLTITAPERARDAVDLLFAQLIPATGEPCR